MTDITSYSFTMERKGEQIIFTYDTDKILTYNVHDVITYKTDTSDIIILKSSVSHDKLKIDYTNCTNLSYDDKDEFLEILRYIFDMRIDFESKVSAGKIERTGIHNIVGYNGDLDADVEETVWNVGGDWSSLSSAETMDIVSSSTNDTSAGTGARIIRIIGLDNNKDEITENVILNGTTIVTTTNSFLIIHYMTIITAGSSNTNDGNITATASTASTVQAKIDTGEGLSKNGFYMVPNKRKAKILSRQYNVRKEFDVTTPIVDITQVNILSTGVRVKAFTVSIDTANKTDMMIKNEVSPYFTSGTCFEYRAKSTNNNTQASVLTYIVLDYDLS
jgi:hypothetical protein